MHESDKKIKKLFIKFISWNKIEKTKKLIEQNLHIIMPWQKAFEETFKNRYIITLLWILEQQNIYNFTINIHFNNNELFMILENDIFYTQDKKNNFLEKIIKLSSVNVI